MKQGPSTCVAEHRDLDEAGHLCSKINQVPRGSYPRSLHSPFVECWYLYEGQVAWQGDKAAEPFTEIKGGCSPNENYANWRTDEWTQAIAPHYT